MNGETAHLDNSVLERPLTSLIELIVSKALPNASRRSDATLGHSKDCSACPAIVKELKAAGDLLAAAVQHYLEVSQKLESDYSRYLPVFKSFGPALQGLGNIDEELALLESHHSNFLLAKATIGQVRNRCSKLVPMNILPHEILCHILHLAITSGQLRNLEPPTSEVPGVIGPIDTAISTLTQVCKSWHQIVINTSTFWSRIDLVASGSHKEVFYARASRFLKRAAGTPLFIHVHTPEKATTDEIQDLAGWLAPIASQIRALNLFESGVDRTSANSVLNCWMKHGAPGAVRALSLRTLGSRRNKFIEACWCSDATLATWKVNTSPQELDRFVRPITQLELQGIFFHWDSQAYHGLLRLRLDVGYISEVQLRAILIESPQLQTLSLGLGITRAEPRGVSPALVQLPCLTNLDLVLLDITILWLTLRLLAPGTRPLKLALSLSGNENIEYTETEEIQAFFQRSNITDLYVHGAQDDFEDMWLPSALKHLPHLRALRLEGCRYEGNFPWFDGNKTVDVCPQLHTLCMFDCKLYLDAFKRMLRLRSLRVLRTSNCTAFSEADFTDTTELNMSAHELQEELSQIVLNTKYCSSELSDEDGFPDSLFDWGIYNV